MKNNITGKRLSKSEVTGGVVVPRMTKMRNTAKINGNAMAQARAEDQGKR